MNILHMKYAVEVAACGSINKAAENLLIAPPNLSRSIKELEASLGVSLFERSARGMLLTPEGERFISYAKNLLGQMDEIETMFREEVSYSQKFSASVPRASYISEGFASFSRSLDFNSAEIFYNETNSQRTMSNVLSGEYKLGIIRYNSEFDRYFKDTLEEKNLIGELICDFRYVLAMSRRCELSRAEQIHFGDLQSLIEVIHGDPYVPFISLSAVKKQEFPDSTDRKIFVFERGSQLDILSANPKTFMWVSPIPAKLTENLGLVQRICDDNKGRYKDVLIYKKEHTLSELDKRFITEVCISKRKYIDGFEDPVTKKHAL